MPDVTPDLPSQISPLLTEEVVDDSRPAPLPEGRSAAAGSPARVSVDPEQEYVGALGATWGGASSSVMAYARTLPDYIDDVTRDYGADLYERMLLDPHIAGEVNDYKLSVLANGVRLLPAVEDSEDDVAQQREHQVAEEIRRFCEACLDQMDTPLMPVLDDMLNAFAMGNRAAELVYRRDGSYLQLHRMKVKHRNAIAYVCDNRDNLIGVLGALAGRTDTVVRPEIVVDPGQTPNFLPESKFAVMSWRPKNGDVRGTSVLRPAYNPWWQKRQTEVELLKYISQFAGSGIFATLPDGAKPVPAYNPDGTVARNAAGEIILQHPQTLLLDALLNWKNGAVVAAPHGTDVKNLVSIGAGAPFFDQLDRCNRDMSHAILGQALASNEGQHNARAAASSHKDLMDILVQWGESTVAAMLRRWVLTPLVEINFGPAYLKYVPLVSLSAVEEADFSGLATAYAGIGYSIDETQTPEIDAKLGLKPRDLETIRAAQQEAANTAAALQQKRKQAAQQDQEPAEFTSKKKAVSPPGSLVRMRRRPGWRIWTGR